MGQHGGARFAIRQDDRRFGPRGYSAKYVTDPVNPWGEQKRFWEKASIASDKLLVLLRTHHGAATPSVRCC